MVPMGDQGHDNLVIDNPLMKSSISSDALFDLLAANSAASTAITASSTTITLSTTASTGTAEKSGEQSDFKAKKQIQLGEKSKKRSENGDMGTRASIQINKNNSERHVVKLDTVASTAALLLNVETHTSSVRNSPNSNDASESNFFDDDSNVDCEPLLNHENDSDQVFILISPERWYTIALQIFIPYLIAGCGMVAAGIVLDKVQHWEVFDKLKEIFVLVPALLGLKGNLEMTLASRLSTQANLGQLNHKKEILKAIIGNLALTQAQAIVVGFLASFGATLLKSIKDGQFHVVSSLVLISGSVCTASIASLLLGGIMMIVIILSRTVNVNPDNVATPLAASLGDLVTLTFLAYFCSWFYELRNLFWIHSIIILAFLALTPLYFYVAHENSFVKDALINGWTPVILAMCISSGGGVILGYAIEYYSGIAVYQPVINGVGGNLVAVFASRLSTALHSSSQLGIPPEWAPKSVLSVPFETFFNKKNPEAVTARVLMTIALPGHVLFLFAISHIKAGHFDITTNFFIFYMCAALLQIFLLIIIGYWIVHFTWRQKKNPDNVCIPYLTAIGDLLGTAFLAISFHSLYLLGQRNLRNKL